MSNKIIAKINFILEMLDNIKTIISRHEGITNALNDRVEARPAFTYVFTTNWRKYE